MSISGISKVVGIRSCDVGSLPSTAPRARASIVGDSRSSEQAVVTAFIDKLKAGISIPAFPQFRDMNEMFLSVIEGFEKTGEGCIETGRLSLKPDSGRLREVAAIEDNAREIHAHAGKPFHLRICLTGPYTLASFFPYRSDQTYEQLGQVLSGIVDQNVFVGKHGDVALVSIDEPLFGIIDDPLTDRGKESREALLGAWESIATRAREKAVQSCIHLHCTSDDLFWEVESLEIIESHIDDPLYEMKSTRQRLEKEDKRLKASIAVADFDRLIKESLRSTASDAVAEAWKHILKSEVDPETFLETVSVMKKRLLKDIDRFGVERVALAGPECGLRSFPTYSSAIEYLRRVSKAVESVVT